MVFRVEDRFYLQGESFRGSVVKDKELALFSSMLAATWGLTDLLPRGGAHTHLATDGSRTSRLDRSYANARPETLLLDTYYKSEVLHEEHVAGQDHTPVLTEFEVLSWSGDMPRFPKRLLGREDFEPRVRKVAERLVRSRLGFELFSPEGRAMIASRGLSAGYPPSWDSRLDPVLTGEAQDFAEAVLQCVRDAVWEVCASLRNAGGGRALTLHAKFQVTRCLYQMVLRGTPGAHTIRSISAMLRQYPALRGYVRIIPIPPSGRSRLQGVMRYQICINGLRSYL